MSRTRTLLAATATATATATAAAAAAVSVGALAPASAVADHRHLSRPQAKAVYAHLVDAVNAGSKAHALKYATANVVNRMLADHDDGEEPQLSHAMSCVTRHHTGNVVCRGKMYEDEDVRSVVLTISAKSHRAIAYAS